MEHGEPEAVERGDHGQQHRVGVRRDGADHEVRDHDQRGQPAAVRDDVGGHVALDADADRGIAADADQQGEHEQEQLGAAAASMHEPEEARGRGGRCPAGHHGRLFGFLELGQLLHGGLRGSEVVDLDGVLHALGVELGQPGELDVGGLVGVGEGDAGQVGVDAAEDRHDAVVLADVVLLLGPRPGHRAGRPDDADHHREHQQPLGPLVAGRRPGRVASRLRVDRVGLDRERHLVEELGVDRLQLAGVAGAVAAEQAAHPAGHRGAAGAAPQLGGRAHQHRLELVVRRVGGCRLLGHDVGDDAGDVVGAAGLEARAHQLDGGVVGGAHREHVGQAAVVEHPAGAVAAKEEAVARHQLEHEQVGLGLVDAVEGLEDQVAVGVHPRLDVGDPALVDEALHERVVGGELRELAVAEEVAAAVADVADADPVAVEQRHGRGGAGAVEGRVLVDQAPDPHVRLVHLLGDPVEQVGLGRRGVERAQLLDRGARGDVAAGGPADAVADGEEPGAGVAGVLVVLADPPDVGDRGVVEAQTHFRSSRMVFPIRTWVPSVMVVGWVMRTVPM